MSVDIMLTASKLLRSKTAITDLTTKIFTDRLPQKIATRAIVLWAITETAHEALDGPIGLDQATIQIDAYAASPGTRAEAQELAWTIWTQIAGYSGTTNNVHIKGVSRRSGVRCPTDRPLLGSDQYRFVATQDILFSYQSLELV